MQSAISHAYTLVLNHGTFLFSTLSLTPLLLPSFGN
jgi:hypothetical protein